MCDLRGKRENEEAFVVVCNNLTKEEIFREPILQAKYDNKIEISQLSPGTLYAAHVCVYNAKFKELTAASEILVFTISGTLYRSVHATSFV